MENGLEYPGYKQVLDNYNILMLATVGSTMFGLNTAENSDIDQIGICMERPEQLLGLTGFEHTIYRSAADRTGNQDAKSEAGDVDLIVYGLRKYVRLLLSGNPTLLNLVYLPREKFQIYTQWAAELQAQRDAFFSRTAVKSFLGYAQAQRQRLEGTRGQMRTHRPELISEHGYDSKYAMHMVRLGMQGLDYTMNRSLTLPLDGERLAVLRDIRMGRLKYETVLEISKYNEENLKLLLDNDKSIPAKPDYDRINNWLVNVYKGEWFQ